MKILFKELWRFKFQIFIILVTIIGNVFCTLSLPNYLSNIINVGIANKDMNIIIKYGNIMIGLTLVAMIFNIITGFLSAKIAMGIGRNLRNIVFAKVQDFSFEEFDKFSTSSLITRTNNDITQIQNFGIIFLRIILMAPLMCVAGIIMAFNKNSSMSSIIFFSIPVLILLVLLIGKKAVPLSKIMQDKIDNVNLVMREKLTGIRVMRAFVTEDHETKRFRAANFDLMDNSLHMQRTIAFMEPVLMLVLNTTVVCLLWISGINISSGSIMPGDIIAIIQYVMQIMMSVTMMSVIFVMYPRAAASASRISEVLNTASTIIYTKKTQEMPNLKGHLLFKNVTFRFSGAEDDAIKNITFESNPGETTAIIGSTGSGKSTLINLIMRFYDPTDGEIFIDGINIKNYSKKDLMGKMGYVPQKSLLFSGSIKENIMMGNENADDNMIKKSTQIAQAYDFVDKKDGGFNYQISQGGTNVSGGQRQRLSIARAIIKKPEIYIFDDSFSALDFKTESELRKALSEETKNSTVIIVAQRVNTIMGADRIIVLDDGVMVGIGPHNELIKNCKTYQEIVHSQLSKEEVGA